MSIGKVYQSIDDIDILQGIISDYDNYKSYI